ncbi:MAG: hypothetical protein ACIAXF_11045 [Phycisphaerales bacterium JB063]
MKPHALRPYRPALLLAATLGGAGQAHAAYISEIYQSGPAGQAIEISSVDPAQGVTLAILNGSRYDPHGFGMVLEVIHIPVNTSTLGDPRVVLITDLPWPDASVQATPLTEIDNASSHDALPLGTSIFDRLLLVFDGHADLRLGENPVNDSLPAARYDADALTDWLAIGPSNLAASYLGSTLDIDAVNATLGIDLLSRIVDRQTGQVIARAQLPGVPLDMDVFYAGNPDANSRFDVAGGLSYRTTPGTANLPLFVNPAPEPGSLSVLLASGTLLIRRRRGGRCSAGARGL